VGVAPTGLGGESGTFFGYQRFAAMLLITY
jgi:hypothetical protein